MLLINLVLESEDVLLSEFGIKPKKTNFNIYTDDAWQLFLINTGSHRSSHGVFFQEIYLLI